mgnify:CR=1 FL=1
MNSQHVSADDCLALVNRSPAAVAVHDRDAWLSIFAQYNIVEDPVGSAPHFSGVYDRRDGRRGFGPLKRFYEAFIAANNIQFYVERDIVCGLHVVRDLTLEILMSGRLTVSVPMHLLYELKVEQGEAGDQLRVFRLAAHWQLRAMLKQQMAHGMDSLIAGSTAGWRMFRHLGVSGIVGFMQALNSVGNQGKQRATQFAYLLKHRHGTGLSDLFAKTNAEVAFPYPDQTMAVSELAKLGGELQYTKLLAAGNVVSASFTYKGETEQYQGVVFFEFERRSMSIVSAKFYSADCG